MKIRFSHARFVLRTNLRCAKKQRKNGDYYKNIIKQRIIVYTLSVIYFFDIIIITLLW